MVYSFTDPSFWSDAGQYHTLPYEPVVNDYYSQPATQQPQPLVQQSGGSTTSIPWNYLLIGAGVLVVVKLLTK